MMSNLGMDAKKLGSRTLFEGVRISKAILLEGVWEYLPECTT